MSDKFNSCSQAMRLGATFRNQGRGNVAMISQKFGCALRAVADAIGAEGDAEAKYSAIKKRFPILKQLVTNPVTREPDCELGALCANLNDVRNWSREQIAEFVALHEQVNHG